MQLLQAVGSDVQNPMNDAKDFITTKIPTLIDVAVGKRPAERIVNLGRCGLVRKHPEDLRSTPG